MNETPESQAAAAIMNLLPPTVTSIGIVGSPALPQTPEIAREVLLHLPIHQTPSRFDDFNRPSTVLMIERCHLSQHLLPLLFDLDIHYKSFSGHSDLAGEELVRHLVGPPSCLLAFPAQACQQRVYPRKTAFTGLHTWSAVAMAVKWGVRVFLYVPYGIPIAEFCGPLTDRAEVVTADAWGTWITLVSRVQDVSREVLCPWPRRRDGGWKGHHGNGATGRRTSGGEFASYDANIGDWLTAVVALPLQSHLLTAQLFCRPF